MSVLAEDGTSSDGHGILKTLQDFTFCLSISNSAVRITDYLIEITYFSPQYYVLYSFNYFIFKSDTPLVKF